MTAKQLAYHQGSFWTFVENEVYQTYPNKERQLVFSLNPGSQIRKIGSSGDYIWVSDGAHFYTYNIKTNELDSFSLLQLYQHSNNSYVYINDAILVETKWALATTSGVYLSEGNKFDHVISSGQNYIEKIILLAYETRDIGRHLKRRVDLQYLRAEQRDRQNWRLPRTDVFRDQSRVLGWH